MAGEEQLAAAPEACPLRAAEVDELAWVNAAATPPFRPPSSAAAAGQGHGALWGQAVQRAASAGDRAWPDFDLDGLPAERALRHSYDADRDSWSSNAETVKMERAPFAKGSLRSCFRTRKLSKWVDVDNWQAASHLVAKRYTNPKLAEEANRRMVMTDVRCR